MTPKQEAVKVYEEEMKSCEVVWNYNWIKGKFTWNDVLCSKTFKLDRSTTGNVAGSVIVGCFNLNSEQRSANLWGLGWLIVLNSKLS